MRKLRTHGLNDVRAGKVASDARRRQRAAEIIQAEAAEETEPALKAKLWKRPVSRSNRA
jgi:hypothetical protein